MKYYICLTPFFPSEDSFRGPFIFDQVKAIERNSDFKVLVFKPYSFMHKEDDYEFEGIRVYRSKDYTLPSNILPNSLSDKLSYKSFLKKLKELQINLENITAIHTHTTNLASYAINLKRDIPHIKTIIQYHGFDVMDETNGKLAKYEWHKKLCRRYGTRLCNEADLIVGVSKKTLEYVKSVEGVHLKNEYILYNGVDTSKFYPSPYSLNSKVLGLRSKFFTIGCVGNFWELKDQMTLIKAVEKVVSINPAPDPSPQVEGEFRGAHRYLRPGTLDTIREDISQSQNLNKPKIKVKFIGTGYTRESCERYIKEHNLTPYFEFMDEIKHKDLPNFYRSLDLFILPSYWEAFGCVYTEAYACGVPFIGVKGQGISEIIDDSEKNKWLIDKGDFEELSKLIIYKMNQSNDRLPSLKYCIDLDALVKDFLWNM